MSVSVRARLALVRHPAAEIARGICYGRLDLPLTPAGRQAVPTIVRQLESFQPATIWSSPSRRCAILAEALADARGSVPHLDARLMELDFGAWEGLGWGEISRTAMDEWAADPLQFAPPGGEAGAALLARVAEFLADLPSAEDHILVTHGGPLRILPALWHGTVPNLFSHAPAPGAVLVLQDDLLVDSA
jgi:alpha-ribazole phosphatase